MGDSLQDQLRALGLARQQQAERKAQAKPGRKQKMPASARPAVPQTELSLDQAYALREKEEQRRVQQAKEKKLAEERRRRAINEAIRAIVESHRLNRDHAEFARNFLYRGRIRKIHVTPEQQAALNTGELGIAYLAGGYHLLSADHVDAVRAISAEHVVEFEPAGDDEADHPVPDDLTW